MSDDIFEFKGRYLAEVERNIAKYPKGREQSAILALLDQAQRQNHDKGNYVTPAAIEVISKMLHMPRIRVMEVATFFTMVNLTPVGKYHLQLCGTTPCMLRGAPSLRKAIEEYLKIKNGDTTPDSLFTLTEVECLGGCANAPVIQVNDDYYEDLDEGTVIKLIESLKAAKPLTRGSQIGRNTSEPIDERLTLTSKNLTEGGAS